MANQTSKSKVSGTIFEDNSSDHLMLRDQKKRVKLGSERERHIFRVGRYGEAKIRAKRVATYLQHNEPDLVKYANIIRTCGNHLTFRHYPKADRYRLISGFTCDKHLLCPVCAIRRGAKQFYKYSRKVEYLLEQNPDLRMVMFTLTIKNRPDLDDAYNHLYESMKSLLQKRRNAHKGLTSCSLALMEGAVWSYEVTHNSKEQTWHPHIHGIGLVPKGTRPKTVEKMLAKEWKKITGDSYILRVETPRNKESRMEAFAEIFKYALKVSELSIPHQVQVFKSLQGRRLTAAFGTLYGLKLEEVEPTEEEYQTYFDLVYRFCGESYVMIDMKTYEDEEVRDHEEITEEPVEIFDRRKEALNDLDAVGEEDHRIKTCYSPVGERKTGTWRTLIKNHVMKNSEQSRECYQKRPEESTTGFVQSAADTFPIGKLTSGHLTHLKHVRHVGPYTERTTKIRRNTKDGKRQSGVHRDHQKNDVGQRNYIQATLW